MDQGFVARMVGEQVQSLRAEMAEAKLDRERSCAEGHVCKDEERDGGVTV